MRFQEITQTYQLRLILVERISVARVQPRTSKGITDLLLPQTSFNLKLKVSLRSQCYYRSNDRLFSRLRSRSLTQ